MEQFIVEKKKLQEEKTELQKDISRTYNDLFTMEEYIKIQKTLWDKEKKKLQEENNKQREDEIKILKDTFKEKKATLKKIIQARANIKTDLLLRKAKEEYKKKADDFKKNLDLFLQETQRMNNENAELGKKIKKLTTDLVTEQQNIRIQYFEGLKKGTKEGIEIGKKEKEKEIEEKEKAKLRRIQEEIKNYNQQEESIKHLGNNLFNAVYIKDVFLHFEEKQMKGRAAAGQPPPEAPFAYMHLTNKDQIRHKLKIIKMANCLGITADAMENFNKIKTIEIEKEDSIAKFIGKKLINAGNYLKNSILKNNKNELKKSNENNENLEERLYKYLNDIMNSSTVDELKKKINNVTEIIKNEKNDFYKEIKKNKESGKYTKECPIIPFFTDYEIFYDCVLDNENKNKIFKEARKKIANESNDIESEKKILDYVLDNQVLNLIKSEFNNSYALVKLSNKSMIKPVNSNNGIKDKYLYLFPSEEKMEKLRKILKDLYKNHHIKFNKSFTELRNDYVNKVGFPYKKYLKDYNIYFNLFGEVSNINGLIGSNNKEIQKIIIVDNKKEFGNFYSTTINNTKKYKKIFEKDVLNYLNEYKYLSKKSFQYNGLYLLHNKKYFKDIKQIKLEKNWTHNTTDNIKDDFNKFFINSAYKKLKSKEIDDDNDMDIGRIIDLCYKKESYFKRKVSKNSGGGRGVTVKFKSKNLNGTINKKNKKYKNHKKIRINQNKTVKFKSYNNKTLKKHRFNNP